MTYRAPLLSVQHQLLTSDSRRQLDELLEFESDDEETNEQGRVGYGFIKPLRIINS